MSDCKAKARDSRSKCMHNNTHPFNGPLSGTTQVSRYHKGKTNLDCTAARDSEWQWHLHFKANMQEIRFPLGLRPRPSSCI